MTLLITKCEVKVDPVSQAVVGSMAAISAIKKKNKASVSFKAMALWGALGGLAPDLDVLIRSANDPLFSVEYHRHFTHSLFFIPIGALIVSLFLRLFRVPIKKSYLYTFLGYATHGTLDAFTNYGTQLFWPTSNMRVALNGVAVIDPLCTIPLVILVLVAIRYKDIRFNYAAIIYLISFLSLGMYQKHRVTNFLVKNSYIEKGTQRFMVKPTIFNNIIWRAIVMNKSHVNFYAIKSIPFGEIKIYPKNDSAKIVKEEEINNLLKHYESEKFAHDYARFKHFTSGYLHWGKDNSIIDSRYSILPYSSEAMWSVRFHREKGHAEFNTSRAVDINSRKEFLKLLFDF